MCSGSEQIVGTNYCDACTRTLRKRSSGFAGREIDIVENRILAIFDGPARAIRCASAITEYASRLDVETCTGLHTGECEIVDGQVAGTAAADVCVRRE